MAKKLYGYRNLWQKQLVYVSKKIKELRKEKISSSEKYANLYNISRTTQTRIEGLERNNADLTVSMLFHQLACLNISPKEFFKDFDDNFSPEEVQKQLKKYLLEENQLRD